MLLGFEAVILYSKRKVKQIHIEKPIIRINLMPQRRNGDS